MITCALNSCRPLQQQPNLPKLLDISQVQVDPNVRTHLRTGLLSASSSSRPSMLAYVSRGTKSDLQ